MEVEVAEFMKRSYEMKISFASKLLELYLVNDNLFVLRTFLVFLIPTRIYTLFYVFFFWANLIRRRRTLSNSTYF